MKHEGMKHGKKLKIVGAAEHSFGHGKKGGKKSSKKHAYKK